MQFEGFDNLMPFRVQNILLVSSLYDSFILREDGRLNELLIGESQDLHLQQIPRITHVSSCREALELAKVGATLQSDSDESGRGRHERGATGAGDQGGGAASAGGGAGVRLSRNQEIRRAQSGDGDRADFLVARQRRGC